MRTFTIALLLAYRQLQRANRWSSLLIVCVMTLTFLNLVAVSGILVGLIAGAERAFQDQLYGDITISARTDEDRILNTQQFIDTLQIAPQVSAFSVRYDSPARVEANYRTRRNLTAERDIVSGRITGIVSKAEDSVTNLSQQVVEGSYPEPGTEGFILIGSLLIDRYAEQFPDIVDSLTDVYPGDRVRVTIGSATQEFTVAGIVDSKVGEVSANMFISEREFRRLANRFDRNADRIAIITNTPEQAISLQSTLLGQGYGEYARIRTFQEALPRFLLDIKETFTILGTFIGGVGVVVASITIFIIIFINALSRRRQIGILKGIGIDQRVIEIAYVLQASAYVLAGSLIGVLITYGILVGYFDRNPLDFPFSDGILVAEPLGTFYRFLVLFFVTLLAGFIPAWLIAKQNTLNAILGRN